MARIDPLAALIPSLLFVGWSSWAIVAGYTAQWTQFGMAAGGACLAALTLVVMARED